jgi:uncharacterized LabA/DUF88 family protein
VNRFAVFVDGGYFNVSAARFLAASASRHAVRFDFRAMRRALESLGRALCHPARLLRIYWYDASLDGRLSAWHLALGDERNLKLRLGHLRGAPPRQKGVDTLLVRDLIVLAQERSISDAVLIAGDEDMREAVVYAQERGVRVHLVAASCSPASWTLRQEADTVTTLMRAHVVTFAWPRDTHGAS